MVGVLGAIMVFMNAPTKTINTFLINVINRVPLPESIKNVIGNDLLGKLKSLGSPKSILDKLPVPDSVKSAIDSILPGNADAPPSSTPPSSAQAPTLVDEKVADIVVPVDAVGAAAATAAVISKTVVSSSPLLPPLLALHSPKFQLLVRPFQTFSQHPHLHPHPHPFTRPNQNQNLNLRKHPLL